MLRHGQTQEQVNKLTHPTHLTQLTPRFPHDDMTLVTYLNWGVCATADRSNQTGRQHPIRANDS